MRQIVRASLLPACLAMLVFSSPAGAGQSAVPEVRAIPAPAIRAIRIEAPTPVAVQTPSGPVRVGGEIQAPKVIKRVNPVYPAEARAARVQGVVIIEAVIGADGRVTDARVLRGDAMLTEPALAAVRQWEYTPTLVNGSPVAVVMTVTVNFTLDNSAALPASPDLTGTWEGDDGAVYQIRTVGNELFWVGTYREPSTANVFHGTWSSGGTYVGRWADVPPGEGRNAGLMTIRVVDANTLQHIGGTASFRARTWRRVTSQ